MIGCHRGKEVGTSCAIKRLMRAASGMGAALLSTQSQRAMQGIVDGLDPSDVIAAMKMG